MEIIEGKVSNYKGHGDIYRFYGKIGEEIKYYFLDFSPLSNGNMIATTELVEAIDSEVPASHIGLVDNDGNVIIPLENKTIKPITGDILLVERLNPLSQNVLDAITASKDTKLATGLVSVTNTCKNKVMEKLGVSSELVFHNQLSEASIFDINGNNLVNNEYYSYIGVNSDKVYLGKNMVDAPIAEYSMLPPEIQSNTMVPDNAVVDNNINVEKTAINSHDIKEAVDGVMAAQEEKTQTSVVEEPQTDTVVSENVPAEVESTDISAETIGLPTVDVPIANVQNETQVVSEEPVVVDSTTEQEVASEGNEVAKESENINEGFNEADIPEVPVDLPIVNENIVDSVVDAAQEVVSEEPAEPTENIVNEEKVDSVDEVLNSLFGNIANEQPDLAEEKTTDEVTAEEVAEATAEEVATDEVAEAPTEEVASEEVADAPTEEVVPEEVAEAPAEEVAPEEVAGAPTEEVAPDEVAGEPAEEVAPEKVVGEPTEEVAPEKVVGEPTEEVAPEEVAGEPTEEVATEDVDQISNTFSDLVNNDSISNDEEEIANGIENTEEVSAIDEADNNIDESEDSEKMFSDINVDKIVTENDYDYNDTYENYNNDLGYDDAFDNQSDDIFSNAGKVMSSLIDLNRKQKLDIDRLNNEINQVNSSNRAKSEKIDLLENKLNSVTTKARNLDTIVNKLESKTTILSSKVEDQKRLIESQSRELSSKDKEIEELRRQLQGKDELAKFIADAQNLLGQNEF